MSYHIPVLLQETLEYLAVKDNGKYIDATLGGGGHTQAILEKGGLVLGIDTDQDAIDHVNENFKFQISNFKLKLAKGNFRDIREIGIEKGFDLVDGILFDFGVSSYQLDTGKRGFSFLKNAALDMRMSRDLGVTAEDLINVLSKKELQRLFSEYGEEPFSGRIASKIVDIRKTEKIKTTTQLAEIIEALVGKGDGIHPATRVFQALRIAVNDELRSIEEAIPKAFDLLGEKGRLVVISFHSLEDRIVKEQFKLLEQYGKGKVITEKIVTATKEEIEKNNRSRSAKLRALEKN